MDHTRLKEVLLAFADDPTTLYFEKNELVVQIQQELISARLQQDGGDLYVEENGVSMIASQWVATRIAQLDQLAYNITQYVQENPVFINTSSHLLDQLRGTGQDSFSATENTREVLCEILGRRPAGMCSIQYLTSDAGEGKTTLINQLAREQAERYRKKLAKWLVVPISLGGNPFLRLENIIAAGLLNQLRMRRFFYEGFIELVRLGFIVLALDGFEEVFVETAGDAVSSLGNLIRDLKGEGTVLIAARTAYFDFRQLDQQARLYDSLPNYEVGFAKLSLDRWTQREFLEMCGAYGLPMGDAVYERLGRVLPADHPLLTRAVFVRRLIDLAKDDDLGFLDSAANLNDFFSPFIDSILDREIRFKWIDGSSGVSMPLLNLTEHHEVLQLLAEEMLLNKRTALPLSSCQDYADIFCDARKKPSMIARQVRDRITSHALLITDATKTQVSFDHDHFREFFLGELVGLYLLSGADADIRKVLRVEALSGFTLDTAVSTCVLRSATASALINRIQAVAKTEGAGSFVRENSGGLITRILNRFEEHTNSTVADLAFPSNALERSLRLVTFEHCYFQGTALSHNLVGVRFVECDFAWVEITEGQQFANLSILNSTVHALTVIRQNGDSREYFEPGIIAALLRSQGVDLGVSAPSRTEKEILHEDENIVIVRKLVTLFTRNTILSEKVLTLKFRTSYAQFESDVLPELLRSGFVVEVTNRGAGTQRRYRLARSIAQISAMLAGCNGSFDTFLTLEKDLADF
jgi:hypothetical protein